MTGQLDAAPPRDRRPWWRRDRRWSSAAAATGVFALAGGVVVTTVGGLPEVLGGEAGFGAATAALVVTGVRLRQGFRGRADDDVTTYTRARPVRLVPTGIVGDTPLAHLTDDAGEEVALLRREILQARQPDGTRRGVETVTARLGGRILRLQHRAGGPEDADGPDEDAPDLVVRWVDPDDVPVAGAHRRAGEDDDHWAVPDTQLTLEFTVPRERGRRPTRRTFVDVATGRAFLLRHTRRRRLPRLTFDAPPELSPAATLLCVWLSHLLDARATAHEPWPAAGAEWTLVEDDFPSFVGPGGFGPTVGSPHGGGGGGFGGGGF